MKFECVCAGPGQLDEQEYGQCIIQYKIIKDKIIKDCIALNCIESLKIEVRL